MAMQYRRLGATGLEISRLALGTMSWGESVDEHVANEQLGVFVDAGGTLVDTAVSYAGGASEMVVGQLLSKNSLRDRIVLASKAGIGSPAHGPSGSARRDASRSSMLRQLDESLAKLGTDHLDLWQVHVWDDQVPVEETLGTLEYALRTGRTRYVGVSNYAGWQTAYAHAWLAGRPDGVVLASTQVEYSLLNRSIEAEVVPAAQTFGIGILAWSPLGRGVLTGKYRAGIPGDSRGASKTMNRFVQPYLDNDSRSVVEALARAADGLDLSMNHTALAWLRDRPAVSSVIVGARTAAQLTHTLESEDVDLPIEIISALDDVSGGSR